jgi:hypothetical protein
VKGQDAYEPDEDVHIDMDVCRSIILSGNVAAKIHSDTWAVRQDLLIAPIGSDDRALLR